MRPRATGTTRPCPCFPCTTLFRYIAEKGKPDEAEAGRGEGHPQQERPDRPATRDAGDEHADERRPGHPPAPVEQCPRPDPVRRLVGVDVKGTGDEGVQLEADILHERLQQEPRGPEEEYERSAGRRIGKACVSTCSCRGAAEREKKT